MKFTVASILLALTLGSCGLRNVTRTTTEVIERIDTVIQVVPDTIYYRAPLLELVEPKVIETERTKIEVRYDTILQTIEVEAVSKPQEIPVKFDRITRTKQVVKSPTRNWFWWGFIIGAVAVILIRIAIKRL